MLNVLNQFFFSEQPVSTTLFPLTIRFNFFRWSVPLEFNVLWLGFFFLVLHLIILIMLFFRALIVEKKILESNFVVESFLTQLFFNKALLIEFWRCNRNIRFFLVRQFIYKNFLLLSKLYFIFFILYFFIWFNLSNDVCYYIIYQNFFLFKNVFFIFAMLSLIMSFFFYFGRFYYEFIINFEIIFFYSFALNIFFFVLIANNFLILFICLEILSYIIYILVAVQKNFNITLSTKKETITDVFIITPNPLAIDAGIKYFIIGSLSSLILIFGIIFLLTTGNRLTMDMVFFYNDYTINPVDDYLEFQLIAFVSIIMYFFFKLSLVPFHFWIVEVFPVSSYFLIFFISIPVKIIVCFLIIHLMFFAYSSFYFVLQFMLYLLIPVSLIVGSFGMYYVTKVKSFIAYSTIYNMGYIFFSIAFMKISTPKDIRVLPTELDVFGVFPRYDLVRYREISSDFRTYVFEFLSGIPITVSSYTFYIYFFGYIITMLLFFFILFTFFKSVRVEIIYITHLNILRKFKPLYYSMLLVLFSMIGIPPLPGFWGKYFFILLLLQLDIHTNVVPLLQELNGFLFFIVILTTILSTYVYLRMIKILIFDFLGKKNSDTTFLEKDIYDNVIILDTNTKIFLIIFWSLFLLFFLFLPFLFQLVYFPFPYTFF